MKKDKICPFCGTLIADDSYFCDQCGRQLFICPNCHQYGKGKFCKHCGTPMVVVTEDELENDEELEQKFLQEEDITQPTDIQLKEQLQNQDHQPDEKGNKESASNSIMKKIKPIKGTNLPKIDIKLN